MRPRTLVHLCKLAMLEVLLQTLYKGDLVNASIKQWTNVLPTREKTR